MLLAVSGVATSSAGERGNDDKEAIQGGVRRAGMKKVNSGRNFWDKSRVMVLLAVLLWMPVSAHAKLIYDTWTTTNSSVGSYVVTVEHNASTSTWDFVFTVLPWDAEGRGLFVDLGDYDLTDTPVVSNVSWYPTEGDGDDVDVKYTDKDTYKCGKGCTIKDLDPPLPDPDDEWELVFELADKGYDGVQFFRFSVNDSALVGITESDWGLIAVASRHLCDSGELLPDDDDDCENKDKAYASGYLAPEVPVPGTPLLIGLGLLLLAGMRSRFPRESINRR